MKYYFCGCFPRVTHFWVRDTDFCIYVEGRKKGSLDVHCGHPGDSTEGRPKDLVLELKI